MRNAGQTLEKAADKATNGSAKKGEKKSPTKGSQKASKKSPKNNPKKKSKGNVKNKRKAADKVSLCKLLSFDRDTLDGGGQLQLFSSQAKYIIGVDEVGRGCLAGPVAAAAVLLPLEDLIRGAQANSLKKRTKDSPPKCPIARDLHELNDSKVLAPEKREFLSGVIRKNAKFAIAESSVLEIDTINILQASLLAMRRAVTILCEEHGVELSESIVLVDGNRLVQGFPESLCRQLTVIGGDSKSASIAAASVIAKVHRDRFMIEMSKEFPTYRWESNKGYGSRVHRDAIRAVGLTEWHRRSFNVFDDTAYDDMGDEFFDADAELGIHLPGIKSSAKGRTKKRTKSGSKGNSKASSKSRAKDGATV